MKTPLAWKNLVHSKMRTAAAVAGVTFAVILIFLQLGFLGTAEQTACLIYNTLDFDVLIRSRQYRRLAEPGTFPRSRLFEAASVAGVGRVLPLHVGARHWLNAFTGRKRVILFLGANPHDPIFTVPEMQGKAALLTAPQFLLIDRKSRPEFGPQNGREFGDADLGAESEVSHQRVRIVGHFLLGASFEADGTVICNADGFHRVSPGQTPQEVTFGLVKLQQGAPVEAVCRQLQSVLPNDVEVFSRADALAFERQLWLREMPVGIIFRLGVAVALVVGTTIVYQVLSSDVASHMPEYATLKAMGYSNRFLSQVVMQEALMLALAGFLPGLAVSVLLYRVTEHVTNLPIGMTLGRAAFVLGMSIGMCGLSGLGALRKVLRAEPAELF